MSKICLVCAAMSAVALAARADITTVYLKETSNYSTGFDGATWVNAGGDAVAIDNQANYDFVVKNRMYVSPRYNNGNGETITAHSVTFGEVGGNSTGAMKYRYQTTFGCADGIYLANGYFYNDLAAADTIAGKVTVTSPSSAPFRLYPDVTGATGFSFPGTFIGAAGVGIKINNAMASSYTVTLADASQYHGDIDLSATNTAGSVFSANLKATTLSAGNVSIGECCTFELTSSAQAVVTNLTMLDGSSLKFTLPASPNATPFLAIGTSLVCDGTIALLLDMSAISRPVSSAVTYPILKVPAASADAVSSLKFDMTDFTSSRPVCTRDVDSETGDVTLNVSFYPAVTAVANLTDGSSLSADAPSSMTNAAAWSDSREVHSCAHYTFNPGKTCYLRTPWYPEGSYVFPGESLFLGNTVRLIVACREFSCPLLRSYHSNGASLLCAEASDVTFHGDIFMLYKLSIRIYNDHCFTLDGGLYGTGDLTLLAGTQASSYKGHHRGDFALTRISEDFAGKIALSSESSADRRTWSSVEPYAHVWYTDPKCFGGPLAAFAYDALKIEKMARLITTNEVVFSDTTRGLYLTNIAQLEMPEADDSLTLLQPVTVNGSVYKQGAGTLSMGGVLKFLDSESALTETPPDDAAKRMLCIQGGTLKPLAADALNGLDIVFSNSVNVAGVNVTDVALELDLDTEDATLRTYGLRNTKSPSPLALSLAGGATRVPVVLKTSAEKPGNGAPIGIMTVTNTVADATFAKLGLVKPDGVSVGMKKRVTYDAEAGTATLSVVFGDSGLMMVIR